MGSLLAELCIIDGGVCTVGLFQIYGYGESNKTAISDCAHCVKIRLRCDGVKSNSARVRENISPFPEDNNVPSRHKRDNGTERRVGLCMNKCRGVATPCEK